MIILARKLLLFFPLKLFYFYFVVLFKLFTSSLIILARKMLYFASKKDIKIVVARFARIVDGNLIIDNHMCKRGEVSRGRSNSSFC